MTNIMERGHYYKNFEISPKLLTSQPILIAVKVTYRNVAFSASYNTIFYSRFRSFPGKYFDGYFIF